MVSQLNPIISGLKNHTRIALGSPEHVRKSISALVQPKSLNIRSQKNPSPEFEFQFEEYRGIKLKQINKALDKAVPLKHPDILHEAMRYTLLAGGKRLLPMLCIASCELVGGNESLAMPMACALQMVATGILILDDLPCMDDDHLRRGIPTNHKVFGEATSILASHALIYHAIEHITTKTKNVPPNRLFEAINELCSGMGSEGVTAGQFEDINSEGKEVSLSKLEYIHSRKTGKFMEAAVVCGGLVGGGNEDEIERLRKYGRKVGMAYQVRNDILDVTGCIEILGKKAGGDLLHDKATYPKLMGIDESMKLARQLLTQANEELAFFDISTKVAPLYHLANNSCSLA